MKAHQIVTAAALCVLVHAHITSAQQEDKQIVYHTFNGEYAHAEALIQKGIQQDPNNPQYYYLRANLAFYTRYFGNTELSATELLDLVAQNSQKAIKLTEDLEQTPDNRFYLGSAYGLLSRANFLKDRSVYDAYSAARDCKSTLEDLVEEDPNYHDAKVGVAVLDYFAATRLTSWWQETIAWITGMSGDKEAALNDLEIVAQKGTLCKAEARFILSTLYRFMEPDPTKARIYLTGFLRDYPQNNFVSNIYRRMQLEDVIQERGIAFLTARIDSLRGEYNINSDGVLNQVGYGFLRNEEFENAIAVLRLNVSLFPNAANCYDSLAEAYMTSGQNEEAVKNYRIALEKIDSDTTRNESARASLRENIEQQLEQLDAT